MNIPDNTIAEPAKQKIKGTGILIQKAVLVIVSDNFFGTSFVLDKPEIIIGRDNSSDVYISDSHISSRHCKFYLAEGGHYFISDLGSKNGTFLNRKKLKKDMQLYYHDRIVIGNTILRYFLEEKLNDE